ncbi:MAG: MG2 domain-containing protein, partial [Verrucomicrobiota bacterium]
MVCRKWFIGLFALSLSLLPFAEAASRKSLWKDVAKANQEGRPKTAITHLEAIVKSALADQEYPEAIRAIGQRISLEGTIQGNKAEERMVRLEEEIEEAPEAMKPMMQAILANWYWHYFQNNRWRFLDRTATAAAPGDDFQTWDLPRLFEEIDRRFTEALAAEASLKKIKVADFSDLLTKGTLSDAYRPTVWDFMVHNALAFYQSGEQAGSKAMDAFDLMADSPIFADAKTFMNWKIETTDTNSVTVKAVQLYQQLLRFHEKDHKPTAFIDADLLRLKFGFNAAFGEDKSERYLAALKRFINEWADEPIAARALHAWASELVSQGNMLEAHAVAKRGLKTHAKTVGGSACHNLIQQIESKEAQIRTERVWNKAGVQIQVDYRNVDKIYFRLYEYDWLEQLKHVRYRPDRLENREYLALLKQKPLRTWSADLPETTNYVRRTENLDAPDDLEPGFYFLFASHDARFRKKNNQVSFTELWVSDLALIMRNRDHFDNMEGFVLDAISGEPIEGATIRTWFYGNNRPEPHIEVKTDAKGLFQFAPKQHRGHIVMAEHKGQRLVTRDDRYHQQLGRHPRTFEKTVFFTDRSLYRPGQTIRYKGICVKARQDKDEYQVLKDRSLKVVFLDVNRKQIAEQRLRSNDYGSFSGSFTAPRDRLMGPMSIEIRGGPGGQAAVRVEEYKRPKFFVTLDKPDEPARLNEEVILKGVATAYTGASISNAKGRYRVVREVNWPVWWGWYYWWLPPRDNQSREIDHGPLQTGPDGRFEITFNARPDPSATEKDEPTFRYAVHVDITDTSGETRT